MSKKDREKEIKYQMYLKSEEIRILKRDLHNLKMQLELLRGENFSRKRKKA